jgi:hypothetical protein
MRQPECTDDNKATAAMHTLPIELPAIAPFSAKPCRATPTAPRRVDIVLEWPRGLLTSISRGSKFNIEPSDFPVV